MGLARRARTSRSKIKKKEGPPALWSGCLMNLSSLFYKNDIRKTQQRVCGIPAAIRRESSRIRANLRRRRAAACTGSESLTAPVEAVGVSKT